MKGTQLWRSPNMDIILFVLFTQLTRQIEGSGGTTGSPTTTTDPPTTTGTTLTTTVAVTTVKDDDTTKLAFTNPVVYGSVAAGAVVLVTGAVVLAIVIKKGLLGAAKTGTVAIAGNNAVAKNATKGKPPKVTKTKVQPTRINVNPKDGRKQSINVVRLQRTTTLSLITETHI